MVPIWHSFPAVCQSVLMKLLLEINEVMVQVCLRPRIWAPSLGEGIITPAVERQASGAVYVQEEGSIA